MSKKSLLKYEETLLFIFASIAFFYGAYILASDFQDFSHLYKVAPAILAFWLPTYVLIVLHLIIHPLSFEKLRQTYKINGIIMGLIGAAGVLWVAILVFIDVYHGFFQGFITPIFPFDIFLIYIAVFFIGAFFAHHGFKIKKKSDQVFAKPESGLVKKILQSLFRPLYLFFALYNFGAFLLGFGFANYGGPTFGYMIPFYALMFLEGGLFLLDELVIRSSGYEALEKKTRKIIAWSVFGFISVLVLLSFLFFLIEPDYLVENAIAYYPLDFMGSYDIAPFITIIPPLLASGSYVLSFVARRKKTL
jgi:hypothetical protein